MSADEAGEPLVSARKMGAQQARSGACASSRPAPGLTMLLLRGCTPNWAANHKTPFLQRNILQPWIPKPLLIALTAPPALPCQRHPMRSFERQLRRPAPFRSSLATLGAVCGGACGEAGPGGQWRRMALEHRKHHVFDVLRIAKEGSQVCM